GRKDYCRGDLMKRRKYRSTKEDIIIEFVVYFSLIFLWIITLYPFLNTLAVSFNDAVDSSKGGITLWPPKFTLFSIRSRLHRKQNFPAPLISMLRSMLSPMSCAFFTAMVPYALCRKEFIFRKLSSDMYVLTMYICGGLIPNFFVFRNLGLTNNFWV